MTTDRDIVEQARNYVQEKTDQCPILDPDSVHEILCDCADAITTLRKRLDQADESAIEQFNEATVLRAEVERLKRNLRAATSPRMSDYGPDTPKEELLIALNALVSR